MHLDYWWNKNILLRKGKYMLPRRWKVLLLFPERLKNFEKVYSSVYKIEKAFKKNKRMQLSRQSMPINPIPPRTKKPLGHSNHYNWWCIRKRSRKVAGSLTDPKKNVQSSEINSAFFAHSAALWWPIIIVGFLSRQSWTWYHKPKGVKVLYRKQYSISMGISKEFISSLYLKSSPSHPSHGSFSSLSTRTVRMLSCQHQLSSASWWDNPIRQRKGIWCISL